MSTENTYIVLENGRANRRYWLDLWAYRSLLLQLARRDVAVHYRQTLIGGLWALIRPLATVAVLTIVFSRVAKLNSEGGAPYSLYVLAAMVPWQLFATVLAESSNSLINNANLVSKVYFPRMVVPLSTVGVPAIDMLVMLPCLAGLMGYHGWVPSMRLLVLPLFLLLAALVALGFGLFLCSLNVKYRDVRYVIPFILQFGVYLSPIGYASSKVPSEYALAYHLNPMVFVIDGVRWSLLGVGDPFRDGYWVVSVAVAVLAVMAGVKLFRSTERSFVDVI